MKCGFFNFMFYYLCVLFGCSVRIVWKGVVWVGFKDCWVRDFDFYVIFFWFLEYFCFFFFVVKIVK